MKIWKYEIPITDDFDLDLPKDSQILCVQTQLQWSNENRWKADIPCVWVLVPNTLEREIRHFSIMGTGHEFDAEGLVYIGTFQQYNGELVWHLFERV